MVIKERLFDDPAREILRRLQPEPLRRPFCRLGTGALRRGFLPQYPIHESLRADADEVDKRVWLYISPFTVVR